MASSLTVWSSAADAHIRSLVADSYDTARRGLAGVTVTPNTATNICGQWYASGPQWQVWELFWSFDTSGVDGAVTVATQSLYPSADYSATDFICQVRAFDWSSGGLTDADFRSGDPDDAGSIDEYTLVASYDTTGGWSGAAYKDFSSEAAFLSNVAQAGTTYLFGASARQLNGDEPTAGEAVAAYSADDATGGGGTDRDPKLYVEWATAAPPTVTIVAISDITENSAASGGWVVADGGAEVTARGVCWNTTGTPTIADSHTSD